MEVTVIDAYPHASKRNRDLERGSEEIGHSMRDNVYRSLHLGRRLATGAASATDSDDRTTRPTTADTLVAHEEYDEPWVSDASRYPEDGGVSGPGLDTRDTIASAQGEDKRGFSLSMHLPPSQGQQEAPLDENNRSGTTQATHTSPPDTTVNLNLYPVRVHNDSNVGNNNADNEIVEVPRGRKGRPGMLPPAFRRTISGFSLVSSGMGRSETSRIPGRSSIPPIFPPPNMPLTYSPHSQPSRARQRTAPPTPTSMVETTVVANYPPSSPTFVPTSRPGTAESVGSIRHHRLDSIRASTHGHGRGHRTPPTRDSSPSRSVRFVDGVDGETGHVGSLDVVSRGRFPF